MRGFLTSACQVSRRPTCCRPSTKHAPQSRLQLRAPHPSTRTRPRWSCCHATSDYKQIEREPVAQRREVERSDWVNTQIVLLVFQMECDASMQRALNIEDYETAQNFREKRAMVDEAAGKIRRQQAGEATGSMDSVADVATEGLRLRTEMQRAVEEERYGDAARYRDMLAEIEKQSLAAQAAADQAAAAPQPALRLGQRVLHKVLGYRGVIAGWDIGCCEEDGWKEATRKEVPLGRGENQPFYHVLVDVRDFEYNRSQPPVAYVAEELLTCPEVDPQVAAHPAFGDDMPRHPLFYRLFLGPDARGDMLPCRHLRDRYNVERRDVHPPEGDEGEEGEEGADQRGNKDGPTEAA